MRPIRYNTQNQSYLHLYRFFFACQNYLRRICVAVLCLRLFMIWTVASLIVLLFQDAVRILLLQFSALLVEHASQHIHDAANK